MSISSTNTENNKMTTPNLPAEYIQISFSSKVKHVAEDSIINDGQSYPLAASPILHQNIKSINLISMKPGKNIIEALIEFKDVSYDYISGDTLGIIPTNDSSEVEGICKRLGLHDKLDAECELSVKSTDSNEKKKIIKKLPPHLPVISTLRNIFEKYVEIRGPPKKLFLRSLAEYTSNEVEKNRLLELCSKEGAAEYEKEFCLASEDQVGPGFGFLNLLHAFPSCVPPVYVVLQHLPRLKPRPYSVASSPLVGDSIRIVFSVYTKKERKGVCTAWLEKFLPSSSIEDKFSSLNINETVFKVPLFIRKNMGFCLPDDPSVPILMIGPGTGVAPYLGFLEHREALKQNQEPTCSIGETWLFYGCQHPEKDFIYENKLKKFVDDGVLSKLFLSFSRFSGSYEGWNGTKHVQDNIKANGKEFIEQLLDKEAVLYISGDAKAMFKVIMCVINTLIQEQKGVSESEASNIIKTLVSKKKYIEDVWY